MIRPVEIHAEIFVKQLFLMDTKIVFDPGLFGQGRRFGGAAKRGKGLDQAGPPFGRQGRAALKERHDGAWI